MHFNLTASNSKVPQKCQSYVEYVETDTFDENSSYCKFIDLVLSTHEYNSKKPAFSKIFSLFIQIIIILCKLQMYQMARRIVSVSINFYSNKFNVWSFLHKHKSVNLNMRHEKQQIDCHVNSIKLNSCCFFSLFVNIYIK